MIMRHNKDTQEESANQNKNSNTTTDIDRYTDLTLMNKKRGVI